VTPTGYLTAEDVTRLLQAAGVRTDQGRPWRPADVVRWLLAAGERRNDLLVVAQTKFHEAFPEVRKALDAVDADEGPARKPAQLKPWYTMREIADLMGAGWSTERVLRWLRAKNAVESHGPRKHVTTPELLARTFPDIYQRIVDSLTENADSDAA
jgi:hypothetical protein